MLTLGKNSLGIKSSRNISYRYNRSQCAQWNKNKRDFNGLRDIFTLENLYKTQLKLSDDYVSQTCHIFDTQIKFKKI